MGISCKFYEISKNTFSYRTPPGGCVWSHGILHYLWSVDSSKTLSSIDCVNIYLLLIFFSTDFSIDCFNIYIFSIFCFYQILYHSHKKRKESLDRVLLAAELEFPKKLVPRLPQHTSHLNTECAGKSKQLYSLYVISFLELIHLNFIFLILICF